MGMSRLVGKLGRRGARLGHFAVTRRGANGGILLYHRVAQPDGDPFGLCVSPKNFAETLDRLKGWGRFLSVGELVRRQRDGTLEPRSMAISFDDGFVDVIENGLPVLERLGVPATIYCIAAGLGQPVWWDRLRAAVSDDAEFSREYTRLLALPATARDEEIGAMATDRPTSGLPRLMDERELAGAAAHPLLSVGAHSVTHSRLAALSPASQAREMRESRARLASIAGDDIRSFSYPFGLWRRDFTATTVACAKEAGFDHALAADWGVVNRRSDRYRLPRLWVHDHSADRIERRVRRWLG